MYLSRKEESDIFILQHLRQITFDLFSQFFYSRYAMLLCDITNYFFKATWGQIFSVKLKARYIFNEIAQTPHVIFNGSSLKTISYLMIAEIVKINPFNAAMLLCVFEMFFHNINIVQQLR